MIGNFSEEAQTILINAKKEMIELGHPYIGTEHLLLSILNTDSNISDRLKEFGLSYDVFREELCRVVGTTNKRGEYFLYTPLLKRVIENAIMDSKDNNDGEVTVEHLFYAILEEGEGIAIRIIIGMGIDIESLYDEFSYSLIKKSKKGKKKKLLISDLGVELTEEAKNGKLDPVIGRDNEVKRVMEILCRRNKNNPILIGDAGVGKTAIVEELARLISEDNVPSSLVGKRIFSLDMATMVAGTKYRGEFEERMKKVIKEIEDNPDIILFIDEVHTLVGAGGAEGAIDASNILKPALARGKIRCIGATTTEEYKKFIEKDSALERRFQKINIKEPSIEETKNILLKIKPIYEKYHNVIISDKIINSIIELSEKYIFDRNRPDKEIDILDEVCSRVGMKESKEESRVRDIKREIFNIDKEKNSFIIDNNIDKAYALRKKETKLVEKLNEIEISIGSGKNRVTINDVMGTINSRTNIPIYELISNDSNSIKSIENNLKKKIIGQDKVVEELISITKRIRYGDRNNCYSFLFVGPSGVGKSELAREYAKEVVGEDNFIRLDMSEYSDSTSVNKLLGSSPGYVGYDDNKNVFEEVRDKPYSVLLLDEIDKAHPTVINLLYQILDEGKVKDSKGKVIRFNNVLIFMTSNIGFEKNSIGFSKVSNNSVISTLKNYFNMAFINRIDNILIFNRLNRDNISDIIKDRLDSISKKYASLCFEYSDSLVNDIIEKSDYFDFGARKIDKIIYKDVENVIIDNLINKKKKVKMTTTG